MIEIPRHVVIVGGSAGRDDARSYKSDHSSIWCVARIYNRLPYADYVFDMHTSEHLWNDATYKAHADRKLVLQQPIPLFPEANILPANELRAEFGTLFTSSFAWMTAYAIHAGAEMLSLVGVNMQHTSELGKQRDTILYLLGFARARQIRVNLPQRSFLRQGVRI